MGEPASDVQWKARYRELVRDFETKEREWASLESALRAAASRLGVAAMGQSDELDAALGPIVESLRTKGAVPQLDTSTTSLVRALKVHESTTQRLAIPDFAKLLSGLLRALGRVPGFADAEAELAERLLTGVAPDAWGTFLDDVARNVGAVVEQLRSQRNQLEEFLEQVTRQLSRLEAWTSWQTSAAQGRRDDTLGLEQSVETEMHRLLRDVDQSPDIDAIKSKVQTRLDAVTAQIKTFRESEERRNAESEQRSEHLRQEVSRLKTRTDELAELCASQEKRLMLDPLTGAHSRYAYDRRLSEEHQTWLRHGRPLTYTIWDLDGFKRVNDQLGHDAGDRLLRAVAELLTRSKREADFLARLGGEEFVLLLPSTTLADGLIAAEKLRKTIEAATFQHKGQREKVTISCGLTEFRTGDTPDAVYDRADRALYAAKQQGRNRCVTA
ncbi:MAG TPA: diguanylate cyclase [Gammaproteobacteria bacterium]|nr:diguanylate cyclase [Gammaproteobacteria bacterium]